MRRRRAAAALFATGALAGGAVLAVAAPGDLSLVSAVGWRDPGRPARRGLGGLGRRPLRGVHLRRQPDRRADAPPSSSTCATASPGTTRLASSNAAGEPANAAVNVQDVDNVQFAISGNGRYVVFASAATNLVAGDDATKDVYRKDLQTGAVTLVSVNTAGQKANAARLRRPRRLLRRPGRLVRERQRHQPVRGRSQQRLGHRRARHRRRDHRRWPPRARPASRPTAPPSGRRSAPTATSWPSRRRRGPSTCSPATS